MSQGIARNKFLAKVRQVSNASILITSVVYAWRRTAHRVIQEAGLTGCAVPIITCITKLIDPPPSQSILRNAAIPNYLIPMPFQKVTPLVVAVYAVQASSHGMS